MVTDVAVGEGVEMTGGKSPEQRKVHFLYAKNLHLLSCLAHLKYDHRGL